MMRSYAMSLRDMRTHFLERLRLVGRYLFSNTQALMKTIATLAITFLLSAVLCADHHQEKAAEAAPFRHVVMFKFKDGATKEQVTAIETAFSALPKKINTITGYEWGTNVGKENKNQGFTHCFIVTFKDQAGLDVYIPHPAHKKFVELLLPSLDKVLVFDFVAKKT